MIEKSDLFIIHDSRDKEFTDPLYSGLRKKNLKVWYDKANLRVGDSLTEKIDEGLKYCNYGILILSKNLLENDRWAGKYELPTLKQRQIIENKKIILPIWLDITEKDLLHFSPWLADIVALKKCDGIDYIIDKVWKKVLEIGEWQPILDMDFTKCLKGKDYKGGIWYGEYRYITFTNNDTGNILKVDVISKEKELRIELWNGIIKQNDEYWWDHHNQEKVSIGTKSEPKVRLNQEMKWSIRPGEYTLFFALYESSGKMVPYNIFYKIEIISSTDSIPIISPLQVAQPPIPTIPTPPTQPPIPAIPTQPPIPNVAKINKLKRLDYKIWKQISQIDKVTIDKINYVQLCTYYQAKLLECNLQTQTAIIAILITENYIEYYSFKGSMYLQFEECGLYVENMASDHISLKIGRLPA